MTALTRGMTAIGFGRVQYRYQEIEKTNRRKAFYKVLAAIGMLLLWQLLLTPGLYWLYASGVNPAVPFSPWILYDPTVNTSFYALNIVACQSVGLLMVFVGFVVTSIAIVIRRNW